MSVFINDTCHRPVCGDLCMLSPTQIHCGLVESQSYLDYFQLDVGVQAFDYFSSVTYAYELTGDTKFLEYRVETVRGLIRNITHGSGSRLASHQCVIYGAGKGSNMGFAASIQHIMVYYKALMDHDMFPGIRGE